jgi:hypothetical protein
MDNMEPAKPISVEDFIVYMRRDLDYLQGLADGLDNTPLKHRVSGISRNLKGLKLSLSGNGPNPQNIKKPDPDVEDADA